MEKIMNHTEYPKQLKNKSIAELRFIAEDAKKAVQAMPDGINAGYYLDEINYCMNEINKRV